MRLFALILFCMLALAGPARAAWREASSDHFVVVADDSENDLRNFADQLERYHAAMALVSATALEKPSPSNRVTIYVVKTSSDVRKLAGGRSGRLAGFYLPRAGGSVAFVPQIKTGSREPDESMIILLHEYAHHFLISSSGFPLPLWMSEGAAEFFASAAFEKDGGVSLGRPANHRAYELFNDEGLKAEDVLLATENEPDGSGFSAFYGKSWLLYHYLFFSKERGTQLQAYGRDLRLGMGLRESAVEAFGDLKQLEKELDGYLRQRRMMSYKFTGANISTGLITIRQLSEGEAAMTPIKIRSRRGVDREQALVVVGEARKVAAQYPLDAAVLSALAEAEYDAGFDKEAIAAADAALAIDERQVNAYVQKGFALFRLAERADDPDAAFAAAIKPFVALNKVENNHPLPLVYYYRSFVQRGEKPSELAVRGLDRAAQLAPFDLGLRFNLAMQNMRDGDREQARYNLAPVAFNPHGGSFAETARGLLERLDNGEDLNLLAKGMEQTPTIADVDEGADGPEDEPGNSE